MMAFTAPDTHEGMKNRSSLLVALLVAGALGCSREVLIGALPDGNSSDPNAPSASDPNAPSSTDPGGPDGNPDTTPGRSLDPNAFCAFTTLASGTDIRSNLALQGDALYWADGLGIRTVPITGGTPQALTAGVPQEDAYLAVNATGVYWSDLDTKAVMRIPLGGGEPSVVATSQGLPGQIAVDADNVYWVELLGVPESRVMKAALAGGDPVELVPASAVLIRGLAVDDEAVYWSTVQGGAPFGGTVMKVPKAGGAAFTIASGLKGPGDIVLDAENVYWSGYVGGIPAQDVVMKASKGGGAASVVAVSRGAPSFTVNEASVYWFEHDLSSPPPDKPGDIGVIRSHFVKASVLAEPASATEALFPGMSLGAPIACPGGTCFLGTVIDASTGFESTLTNVMRYGACP
jgi:hypothetical protein